MKPTFPFALRLGLLGLAALAAACSRDASTPGAAPLPAYAAVARGRIDVEGGLINIGAPMEGRIARVLVREGQSVRRGEALLELDDAAAKLAVDAARAAVDEAAAQLRVLSAQTTAATTRAGRLRAAADAGAAEGQAADDAQAQAQQLLAQQDVARAAQAAARARLAATRHTVSLHRLVAPQEGQITQVTLSAGAQVAPSTGPLLVLLPRTPRIVRAELAEGLADSVQPGMTAQVSPEDEPNRVSKATVLRVGAVVAPARLEDDPQRRGIERTVECVLQLEDEAMLRVGQRVLARIGSRTP